ncbi:TIGR02996 domain-containing protein [Gemmata sp. JC717]|uniref:TIGR02996 domain-containing protein n=1 Tax=Gemmata algarum TaxID=2975278 RepID=UPI0021BA7686|nr:TIGR02996 domain-containing protein [Gemmata algarum]MDY3553358.1 TIGR02996 domain-containing protein [Gemmata algarum]
MAEDEPFIRALLAAPDDQTARLIYADWLDDRNDPRAEYLRLSARVAELPLGSDERQTARERMLALQNGCPSWWLAAVGFSAVPHEPNPARVEYAAQALKRPMAYTDLFDYEITMHAAAISAAGCIAFLESRSKLNGGYQDIRYDLRLRDPASKRGAVCELYTHNPYFGCGVQFFEWYGDAALLIYQEKRSVQVCRFGFDNRPAYRAAGRIWRLYGRVLAFGDAGVTHVCRLSLPNLEELPPLSESAARERDIWPE